jgi:hypothetical protein
MKPVLIKVMYNNDKIHKSDSHNLSYIINNKLRITVSMKLKLKYNNGTVIINII